MMWWPGGLQLVFFISAMISSAQATMFQNAWFRNFAGMQPLPERAAPKTQSQTYAGALNRYQSPSSTPSTPGNSKGMFGNIKGAVSDIMKLGEKLSPISRPGQKDTRLTDAEKRQAKTYEARRQREIAREYEMKRDLAQTKFERQQERETREQERKERLQIRAEKKAKHRQ